jgi:DNA-binding NtrC family response regulator
LSILVPPLRERGNDVCEIADYFVQTLNNPKKNRMHISEDVYAVLQSYPWPGNIRELENAMERAINVADGTEIRIEHLPRHIYEQPTAEPAERSGSEETPERAADMNLKNSGYQLILTSLENTNGNIKEAASLLGISRRTLYRKMDKYGIPYQDFRDK